MLMCLPLMMAGCSKDNNEDTPVGPDPEIPNENASGYIEFTGSVLPFTRSNVDEASANEAHLYAWTKEKVRKTIVSASLQREAYVDLVFYKPKKASFTIDPGYVTLTRNVDDPTVWEYSPKLKWSDFVDNPISFLGIIEPKDCKAPLTFEGSEKPFELSRHAGYTEYDATYNESYYNSGDLNDVMIAYARECGYEEFGDSMEVDLNFRHLFPRFILNAKLGEQNALEVNVKEAYLYGIQVNGKKSIDADCDFNDSWTTQTSPLSQYIQMDLSNPVKLTGEAQPLVDSGHEPHLVPQQVKPWTSYVNRDGAGIIMYVNIRNIHDGSWIVGNENEYGYVHIPFPVEKLEMGMMYNIDIVFGAMYRDNGTACGYQLSYQPQIVEWDVNSEYVELMKKK